MASGPEKPPFVVSAAMFFIYPASTLPSWHSVTGWLSALSDNEGLSKGTSHVDYAFDACLSPLRLSAGAR
ncbi:MAG: hypothetical protein KGJ57_06315 [Sphingomonadales bacterium]|nr:hypothetical protein [Sphingomonadales bacterium]MDE2169034.1 hypothetical protein [Sphingomonadales bacterium]